MQEALQQLGIKEINEGTSTGTKWFSTEKSSNHIHQQLGDLIGKAKIFNKRRL